MLKKKNLSFRGFTVPINSVSFNIHTVKIQIVLNLILNNFLFRYSFRRCLYYYGYVVLRGSGNIWKFCKYNTCKCSYSSLYTLLLYV